MRDGRTASDGKASESRSLVTWQAARETIFALSSAPGVAGVAVIRVSGPGAGRALQLMTRRPLPQPRQAVVRAIHQPESGEARATGGDVIDRALVLWFPGPGSFTGEDCVEIQCHGGRAIVSAILAALGRMEGLRLAEPGEFTRRAVDHGRLDLTQAEGLIDLIQAETETQRQLALRQMDGVLRDLYTGWRERLVRLLAHSEAEIDFPDEGDAPRDVIQAMDQEIQAVRDAIDGHLADGHRGQRIRDGLVVALIGAPNAGKSTILNRLARRDVAIVSPVPGTTRDILEVPLDLQGIPVTVADMAGLRETDHLVEKEGIRRAENLATRADFRVAVFDLGETGPLKKIVTKHLKEDDFVLLNKKDKVTGRRLRDLEALESSNPDRVFAVSALSGEGMSRFLGALEQGAVSRTGSMETPLLTRQRHRDALTACRGDLSRILEQPYSEAELRAEDLRRAVRALGRITGAVDVEALLDVVFQDFCIGK